MSEKDIRYNLKLSADFNDYVVKHPEIMRGVSSDSCIVFTPFSNPGLTEKNLKLGEKILRHERKKVYTAIRVKKRWKVEPLKS